MQMGTYIFTCLKYYKQCQLLPRFDGTNCKQSQSEMEKILSTNLIRMNKNNFMFESGNIAKVTPQKMNLPTHVGEFELKTLTWLDFPCEKPENSSYNAHIFWYVSYETFWDHDNHSSVKVDVQVQNNSWFNAIQVENEPLLRHEYGHYLIACCLALNFQEEVNKEERQFETFEEFDEYCKSIFQKYHNHYVQMEILYDQQTEHYENKTKQAEWEDKLREKVIGFIKF